MRTPLGSIASLAVVLALAPRAAAQCEIPRTERRACERLAEGARRDACLHFARGMALLSDDCGEVSDGIAELRASYDGYPQWAVADELLQRLRRDDDRRVDELTLIERVLADAPSGLGSSDRSQLETRRDSLLARLGTIVVHVEPEDAVVSIGDRPVEAGVPVRLSPGDYEVRATRSGYRRALEVLTAAPGRTEELTLRLVRSEEAAFLDIQTDPANADVYIDGEHIGLSPRRGIALAMGGHTLRIELDRFDPVTRALTLAAHEHQTVDISLTLHREIYEEWWFWTLIVLAVAVGPTTYGILYGTRIQAPPGTIGTVSL